MTTRDMALLVTLGELCHENFTLTYETPTCCDMAGFDSFTGRLKEEWPIPGDLGQDEWDGARAADKAGTGLWELIVYPNNSVSSYRFYGPDPASVLADAVTVIRADRALADKRGR